MTHMTSSALTLGAAKADVLTQMGSPTQEPVANAMQSLSRGYDYAESDVGQDISFATFTNGQATNLQPLRGFNGPVGASDVALHALA
jgi:hypothetical protein